MKNMTTGKKLLILFGGILLVFGIINLVWFIGIKCKYISNSKNMQAAEEIGKVSAKNSYYHIEDGYEYMVAHPGYLGGNGFFAVSREEGYSVTIDENGEFLSDNGVCVTLYIWPKMFYYMYGVDIYSEKENIWYQIYIDENGNLVTDDEKNIELNESKQVVLEEYETEIANLLELAKNQWELK